MMTRPQGQAVSAPDGREAWVDLAKGFAVSLVVLLHAQTVLAHGGWLGSGWGTAMEALSTLRMPTFFLISGLFAQKSLTIRSSIFRTQKIWAFLWLYLLWSAFYILPFEFVGRVSMNSAFLQKADQWATETFMVNGVLWYLVALPVFFLAARLLWRVPVRIQITCAAALSFAFSSNLVNAGQWGVDRLSANFVYFLTGCYFSTAIRSAAMRAGWSTAITIGLAWIGLSVGVFVLHWPVVDAAGWPGIGPALLPLLAIPFVLASAPLVARRAWANPLIWLGRNTLPVYVMHIAAIYILVFFLQRVEVLAVGSWLTTIMPLLVAVAATGITLAIRPLLAHWAPWSLRLPAKFAQRKDAESRPRRHEPLWPLKRPSRLPLRWRTHAEDSVRTRPWRSRAGPRSAARPGRLGPASVKSPSEDGRDAREDQPTQ